LRFKKKVFLRVTVFSKDKRYYGKVITEDEEPVGKASARKVEDLKEVLLDILKETEFRNYDVVDLLWETAFEQRVKASKGDNFKELKEKGEVLINILGGVTTYKGRIVHHLLEEITGLREDVKILNKIYEKVKKDNDQKI